MKSKARRVLEKWRDLPYKSKMPTYLAEGTVFLFPAQDVDATHYLVTRMVRSTPKRVYVEWACSCKSFGFRQDGTDDCKHVLRLKDEWEAAS